MKPSESLTISREIRTYWKIMLTGFVLALLTDGLALIPPVIMQILIDDVIPNGTLKNVILLVVLFISLPVINGLISALRTVWAAMKCRRASYVINSGVIDHIMGQPMRFHVEKSSAELASECSRSAIDYTYLWTDEIPKTAATLVTALIALVFLFHASGWIALSQIVLVPVLLIPNLFARKLISRYSAVLFKAINAINSMLIESFRGIRMIKNWNLESLVLKKYQKLYGDVDDCFRKTVRIESFSSSVASQFVLSLFTGIAFIIGVAEIMRGHMTIGLLVSSLSFIAKYQTGVLALMYANLNYAKQVSTFEPLFAYRVMPKEGDGKNAVPEAFLQQGLEVKNLSFSYEPDKPVLTDLSLTIPAHSWTGIRGRSGIGKSTLLDVLTRIEHVDGAVYLDGTDIETLNLYWYRKQIAVVPQTPFLFKDTVRANFRYVAPNLTDDAIWDALRAVCLDERVRSFPGGLDTMLGEDGQDISGGEKQRMALAIALASRRPLLILDEATSNLDETVEARIAKVLNDMVHAGRITILSVSHRPAFHRYCSQIVDL